MSGDASFADGAERPLRLKAETADDLQVMSALVQDALTTPAETAWMPRRRRFSLLINRFRWEDAARAERRGRPFERVQTMLVIDDVHRARSSGLDPGDREVVVSILALEFEPGPDGSGTVRLVLSGDGELALDVECLNVSLTDVARPHLAKSPRPPRHSEV